MLHLMLVWGILFTLLLPTWSIKCHDDISLDNVQEYEFIIPHTTTFKDFKEYWGIYLTTDTDSRGISRDIYQVSYHMSYILFGKFEGDPSEETSITAGLYTSQDELIYSVTIDCEANMWTSRIIGNVSKVEEVYQSGALTTSCQDGEVFDIWGKVEQPFMMNWLYGPQILQYNITRETSWDRGQRRARNRNNAPYVPHAPPAVWRERTLPIPTLHGADKAHKYKVQATGAALVTRLAFGKCVAWPDQMSSNCSAAEEWVFARSHKDPKQVADPNSALSVKWHGYGQGIFGAVNQVFRPHCVNSLYFDNLQTTIHPDQLNGKQGASWCCCVDMRTGKIYQDNPDKYCRVHFMNRCTLNCLETYEKSLWEGSLWERSLWEEIQEQLI